MSDHSYDLKMMKGSKAMTVPDAEAGGTLVAVWPKPTCLH